MRDQEIEKACMGEFVSAGSHPTCLQLAVGPGWGWKSGTQARPPGGWQKPQGLSLHCRLLGSGPGRENLTSQGCVVTPQPQQTAMDCPCCATPCQQVLLVARHHFCSTA